MERFHLTFKSGNKKTGKISVATSSANTCPDTCPLKRNGCYAFGGPLRLHWRKTSRNGVHFKTLLEKIADLPRPRRLRLWQAGDMPGYRDLIRFKDIKKLVRACRGLETFTYTHKPIHKRINAKIVKYCNDNGITVNLSANNLNQADELYDANVGPVVSTLPDKSKNITTPKGRRVVICPAVLSENITCENCGGNKRALCDRPDRDYIIGFPAHGYAKNKVADISKSNGSMI